MIKTLLVFGTAAGLVLAAAAASAGTCTTEIETLQKKLSSSDAGMGPAGNSVGGNGVGGTIAETGKLQPPTGAMNEATQGKAASPNDVLSQNQGAPTDAEAATAGQFGTAAGIAQASEALQRARQLDQAGDETACMNEIGTAKTQLGLQ
jgi:hypothetical protein